jgi:hypothetical protein
MEQCTCGSKISDGGLSTMHFEIPQVMTEFDGGIAYIGSTDKQNPFIYYTSPTQLKYHKYRKRGQNKPYVYIDVTPNANNMFDCWVFNAPMLKQVSVIAIFKNVNQLEGCDCTESVDLNNLSFIDQEVKRRVTELKIKYYRQLAPPIMPND